MEKTHFSIFIKAPREKVWNTMLEDATYRIWTQPFHPGSYYVGSWDQGSEIRFLGPDPEGKHEGGMLARISENRLYEFVSVEMIGMIKDGEVDTTSEQVKKWTPTFENYTFTEKDGGTEVSVDIDVPSDYKADFEDMWPKALLKLKEISEN